MTINKSQEQSFTRVGLYLSRSIFTRDQLYIAIYRVRTKKWLKILILNEDENVTTTKNVCTKKSSKLIRTTFCNIFKVYNFFLFELFISIKDVEKNIYYQ